MSLDPEQLGREVRAKLAKNWGWIVFSGVLMIVMGAAAILAPVIASVAIDIWLGVTFVIAGIVQLAQVFYQGGWRDRLGHVLVGIVYLLGGVLALVNPAAGLMAFSFLVVIILLVAGVFRIIVGLRMRPEKGWGWMTAAGVAALAAGLIVYGAFPGAALWLLGLLAGVVFITDGSTLLALGLAARKMRT